MKIRYSMLDSFLSCPLGFKRRYIDCIEDTEKSSALELGTSLHLALKTHFEGGNAVEVFNLMWDSLKNTEMKYYRHSWSELRNLANTKWLPNFTRLHAKNFKETSQEVTLEMPFCGHTLSGTYDMLSDYDGVKTVTDWKTSGAEYKKDKILKNPQLYIYAALIQHHNPEIKIQQLQYKVFQKNTGSIQTLKTELTQEKLENQMKSVCNVIKTMVHCIENNNWFHRFDCWCELEEGK